MVRRRLKRATPVKPGHVGGESAVKPRVRHARRPKEEAPSLTSTRANWHSVGSAVLDLNVGHFSLGDYLTGVQK